MNLRIRALSIHATYRCGHSGACCTAGWPIPVERETHARLVGALNRGALAPDAAPTWGAAPKADATPSDHALDERAWTRAGEVREHLLFLAPADAPPETPVVTAADAHGACVFYEPVRRRCAIHRQLGEALLPDTCRQFPRVSLLDGRGLSVTLSHFCPTAAGLLFEEHLLRVVESPPAFPATFPFDPLDARDALPPLLHPKVLLDLDTFDRWERTAVGLLAQRDRTPEDALTAVSILTESLRRWEPGTNDARDALADAVMSADARAAGAGASERAFDAARAAAHYELVRCAIPAAFRPATMDVDLLAAADARLVADTWGAYAAPIRRYLATKIFASWLAYQGRGLRTIVFSAAVALSLVRAFAALESERVGHALDRRALTLGVRRADELLTHLASRQPLADAFSAVEASLAAP